MLIKGIGAKVATLPRASFCLNPSLSGIGLDLLKENAPEHEENKQYEDHFYACVASLQNIQIITLPVKDQANYLGIICF